MKKYTVKISGTYWIEAEVIARNDELALDMAKWKAEEHFENFNRHDDESVEYNFSMDKIKAEPK